MRPETHLDEEFWLQKVWGGYEGPASPVREDLQGSLCYNDTKCGHSSRSYGAARLYRSRVCITEDHSNFREGLF